VTLRLLILVVSIGLADSLNPSTIGPALYLATTEHGRRRVAEFALGVFGVNFLGGIAIALGPGQLLLSLVPHPHPTAKHTIELVIGVAAIALAAILWHRRKRLAGGPRKSPKQRSALALGAGITALELPTAFPFFAVIAVIVGADIAIPAQIGLLGIFSLAFITPLLAILVVLVAAGDHADRVLAPAGAWLQTHWPVLLAVLALIIGVGFVGLGLGGLLAG
jgi:cytochrome c biogenesis protein CcdA